MGRFRRQTVPKVAVLMVVSISPAVGEQPTLAVPGNDEPRVQQSAERALEQGPRAEGRFPVRLRILVREAHSIAVDRLREHAECRSLFADVGADGFDVLTDVSYVVGSSAVARRVCGNAGVAAYTAIGAAEVSLCSPTFGRLNRYQAATLLLHEALHSAGLSEKPHDPEALTSGQINDLVESRCRL